MAIVKFSALVSSMVGKLGGSYFQRNGGGIIIKNIGQPVNGAKLTKADAGRNLSNTAVVAKTWSTITDGEREGWISAAAGMERKNKAGDIYVPSGYQVFMEYNGRRVGNGNSIVPVYDETSLVTDLSLVDVIADPVDGIKFTNGNPSDLSMVYNVFATFVQSYGKRYPKGSYRKIASISGSVASSILNSAYQDSFGLVPASGNVYFRIEAQVVASGRSEGAKLTKMDAGKL